MNDEALARSHYRQQAAIVRRVLASVLAWWKRLDGRDLSTSWNAGIGPATLALVAAAQLEAATRAGEYVPAAVEAQGGISEAAGVLVPAVLSGIASDGRELATLLYVPVLRAKQLIGDGATLPDALGEAGRQLAMLVSTQVADAGRVAASVAMTADRAIAGYERIVNPPACSRCIILAGRLYTWSRGFQRHPRCDCVHKTVTHEQWRTENLGNDPRKLFDAMSRAEQDRVFGRAGAEAIRHGADIAQVVNARRGMATAGGRRFTSEGATARGLAGRRLGELAKQPGGGLYRRSQIPRLMPEQILLEAAGDRDEAIRLLRRFGYLL